MSSRQGPSPAPYIRSLISPHLISPPPVPANSLLPRPMVPVNGLPAGNDGGPPAGAGQPAHHPRHGRQLLHRPWTARDGRHLPQGPKDQVTTEIFVHHFQTDIGWPSLPMPLPCLPARARQRSVLTRRDIYKLTSSLFSSRIIKTL